jgi:hypothetical protein
MDNPSASSEFAFMENRWARRFMAAAIMQGAILVGLTAFLVLSQISFLKPEVSKVMAAGSAGTWLTFGYIIYILIGVIGVAVSSIFYHYLGEGSTNARRSRSIRASNVLAWIHLFLMNAGIFATCIMMMYAGYVAGSSMLPISSGGKGYTAIQAHGLIGIYVDPISVAILLVLVGVTAGGAGFLLNYRRLQQERKQREFRGASSKRDSRADSSAVV